MFALVISLCKIGMLGWCLFKALGISKGFGLLTKSYL